MKKLLICALICATPLAALAADPVSPSQFREYAEGWTLYFERDGKPFGSETFAKDGKTEWRYNDGSCARGAWRAHGAQLCFLYEAQSSEGGVQCWRMLRDEQGLYAKLLTGDNPGLELRVSRRDRQPLLCGSPGLGT